MSKGLTHEQVMLLFLQLGLLLTCARLLGELLKRLGQPAVLGELLAGILLGPSLLGWQAPEVSQLLFPTTVAWPPVLETVSWLGLVMLMLLTGLETDVRLLRSLGRPAFMASSFGLVIPFASGLALAHSLPDRFVTAGQPRIVLALFLATAMSVSAMPVIAKILMDLKLIKRNLGVVTLTAAVVDDTVGWIALAMIAAVATGGQIQAGHLLETLGLLVLFLAAARYVAYPLVRWSLRAVDGARAMPGTDIVIVFVFAFACAAATEAIGVHAVFGAFVAGTVLRQCPALSRESIHRIEGVAMAVFAPIFFGSVGLKVDFTQVQGHEWPLIVIGTATAGKVIGCLSGGLLGRLAFVESLVLGLSMNARGAMELVVAVVGLSLGVIGQELFAIIVLMAMVTSFMAPLTIKPLVRFLPFSDEEREREKEAPPAFVSRPGRRRFLIPAAGGPNALIACHVAATLCATEGDAAVALYVQARKPRWWRRLVFWRRRRVLDVETFFSQIRSMAEGRQAQFSVMKTPAEGSIQATILGEAAKGHEFIFLGASGRSHPVYDPMIADIIRAAPCHIVVMKGWADQIDSVFPMKRILVPSGGSYASDAAFQLAAAYAERVGARVTVLHVIASQERSQTLPTLKTDGEDLRAQEGQRDSLRAQFLAKIRPELLDCRVRRDRSVAAGLVAEVSEQAYDLVVLGVENKSIVERVYFGQNVEAALESLRCAVAIVIPRVAGR